MTIHFCYRVDRMLGTLSVDTCNFYLVVQLYLFYVTRFHLLPTLFNYSKVERVLTPLVFIAFVIFLCY